MKTLLKLLFMAVLALVGYLLLWPVPIEPVAWSPAVSPGFDSGSFASNERLSGVQRLGQGFAVGPEDVDVDSQGRIVVGYKDGRIVRFAADGTKPEELANTGGVPLGLAWQNDSTLIIADADKGLMALTTEGEHKGNLWVLSTEADGKPFRFVDDVDIAPDGKIYFSDASSKFGFEHGRLDIIEHAGNGRLLEYDPVSGTTRQLMDGLQFANGIAVGPDGAFVLVNETAAYRTQRYWLKGERAGQSEIFIDNLPGMPDGISHDGNGNFWLAIYAARVAMVDNSADKPWLRKVFARIPDAFVPVGSSHAIVFGLNASGEVIHNLQSKAEDSYWPITSVQQVGDQLYIGSLGQDSIGRIAVPKG